MGPQTVSWYPGLPVPLGAAVTASDPEPCPYLPGRVRVSRGFRCVQMPPAALQAFFDAGFRRSGDVFYQMVCPGCRACVPLRTPVAGFAPSRSQRRVLGRNRDLRLAVGRPSLTPEKHGVYARYLAARHDGTMDGEWEELAAFLYRSPTDTIEMCYRDPAGRLLAVGICDLTPTALSTVYFYFDPDQGRRSLGTFSCLAELRLARTLGLSAYYLGYWVEASRAMAYKASFRPCETLGTDGEWRPVVARAGEGG